MPAISLGFGEVEERLQQIRRRLNLLSFQHVAYLSGTLFVLLGALLVVVALRAPPDVFRWYLVGYAVVVCAGAGTATFRLRARWLSMEAIARLADREAHLDSRLSTLYAQRSRPQRSRLGGILLAQTLALGPRWDRSALAPRRVPRSLYPLLVSFAFLGATWFVPSLPSESPVAGNEPSTTADEQSPALEKQSVNMAALPMPRSKEDASGVDGAEMGVTRKGSPGSAGAISDLQSLDDSPDHRAAAEGTNGGSTGADAAPEKGSQDPAMQIGEDGPQIQSAEANLREPPRDTLDRRPSTERRFAAEEETVAQGHQAKRDPDTRQTNGDAQAQSRAQESRMENATTKGGARPSGKIGSPMNDSLYADAQAQAARRGEAGEPGTFALRLTGVSAAAPADFEPQDRKPQVGARGFGVRESSRQTELAEHQVEDEPLQKALISPEHESLVQRIFRRD
jgi:hypothetical protein